MRTIHFDGGTERKCSVGFVVLNQGEVESRHGGLLPQGITTNNEAEWCALILAAEYANRQGWVGCDFYGDSKLVVMQVRDEWKVKKPHLKKFHRLGRELVRSGQHRVHHHGRALNHLADQAGRDAVQRWG